MGVSSALPVRARRQLTFAINVPHPQRASPLVAVSPALRQIGAGLAVRLVHNVLVPLLRSEIAGDAVAGLGDRVLENGYPEADGVIVAGCGEIPAVRTEGESIQRLVVSHG